MPPSLRSHCHKRCFDGPPDVQYPLVGRHNHGFSTQDFAEATVTEMVVGPYTKVSTRSIARALCHSCRPFLREALWPYAMSERLRPHSRRSYSLMEYRECAFCNLILLHCRKIAAVRRVSGPRPFKVDIYCDKAPDASTDRRAVFRIVPRFTGTHVNHAATPTVFTFATLSLSQPPRYDIYKQTIPPKLTMSVLQAWLDRARHSTANPGPRAATPAAKSTDIILIDCHKSCLVYGRTSYKYLALSYVWGKRKPSWLFTSKANVAALSRRSSLASNTLYGQRLPRVIREAIQLTKGLNLCYLWVDAVCIVQDCDESRTHMIEAMCEIYRNALATIMLPSCMGADDTIPGLNYPRQIANDRYAQIDVGGLSYYINSAFDPVYYIREGFHNTRAWTLQEHALSTRLLVLTPGEAFLCQQDRIWREASPNVIQIPAGPTEDTVDQQNSLMNILWPLRAVHASLDNDTELASLFGRCRAYSSLVGRFTDRRLTHPNDILRAFTGIYYALCQPGNRVLSIDITQGINPHLLPYSLCWKGSRWPPIRQLPTMRLSSWTWATQPGCVRYPDVNELSRVAVAHSFYFGAHRSSREGSPPTCANMVLVSKLRELFGAGGRSMDDMEVPLSLSPCELGFWAICLRRSHWCFDPPQTLNPPYSSTVRFAADTAAIGEATFDHDRWQQPIELVCLYLTPGLLPAGLVAYGLMVQTTGAVTKRVGVFELSFPWGLAKTHCSLEVDHKFVALQ